MNRRMIRASLFTALMILGAFIRVPIGPVPVTLSSLFVLLAGLLLGAGWGAAAVSMYLLLGALGLPVFTAGGGIALFAGPTGGYLLGFLQLILKQMKIICSWYLTHHSHREFIIYVDQLLKS